jgi:hypothetical protein
MISRDLRLVLMVERVNALRVIRQSERDVSGQGLRHKTIDRIIHHWNFITPGAANEQRRNFPRIFLEVSHRRKSRKGLLP